MSLDIGFETIVLLIATIIQNDRMHISQKQFKIYKIRCLNSRMSNKENICFLFLFLVPFSLLGDQCMSLDIGFETIVILITTIIQSDRIHILAKIV